MGAGTWQRWLGEIEKRVVKYLNGARFLKLTVSTNQLKLGSQWNLDRLHQIHKDCQGETDILVRSRKGAVASLFTKMKFNNKSSTKTELIILANKLGDIIWLNYFMEYQGYNVDEYVVFYDNMSVMSLDKNWHTLSSKWTKHIKAKYFLIKDYYNAGEFDVKFCPTDEMWANVLTKPLQG